MRSGVAMTRSRRRLRWHSNSAGRLSRSRGGQSMTAETLLAKLDRVKRTGPDRWIASYPAHHDDKPSLAIRDCGDGRVLVHCIVGRSALTAQQVLLHVARFRKCNV